MSLNHALFKSGWKHETYPQKQKITNHKGKCKEAPEKDYIKRSKEERSSEKVVDVGNSNDGGDGGGLTFRQGYIW